MYAWCQNMPGVSADDYANVLAELGGAEQAPGLVAHVAGPVDGGFRIVDVWQSKADADRFASEHLQPAVGRAYQGRETQTQAAFTTFEVSD